MPNTQDQAITGVAQAFGAGAPNGLTPEQQNAFNQVENAFAQSGQQVQPNSNGQIGNTSVIQGSAPTGAIKSAGGFWVVPGSTKHYSSPPSKSDGAVSSNDVVIGHGQEATNASATSSLTGNVLQNTPPWLQTIMTGLQSNNANQQALNSKIYQSIGKSYDAQLASTNAMYAQEFDKLAKQHINEVQSAQASAVSLDPYSQNAQSSTAKGFTDTIDNNYQGAYSRLSAKMQAAQMQLQAGRTKDYLALAQSAQDEASSFSRNMANVSMEWSKQQQSQAQRDTAQSNNERNFGFSMQEQGQRDFNTMLTQLSGSPQLQTDISNYETSGEVSPGLNTILKKGEQAGLAPQEAINMFKYQSQNVRNQNALEQYRTRTQANTEERIALSKIKATSQIATTNALLAVEQNLRSRGVKPGTLEWSTGVASATVASQRGISPKQIKKYTQMGTLINQLSSFKREIDSLSDSSPVWTTLQQYAGRTVSSFTDAQLAQLNAQLKAMSGIIGKTFYGESGNLSDSDIQRILDSLPMSGGTAALRQGLYKGLMTVAKDNAIQTLQNDAQAGYSVAPYIDSVRKIAKIAGSTLSDTGGKSKKNEFVSPSGKTYNLPF